MKILAQKNLENKQVKVVVCTLCESELGLYMSDMEALQVGHGLSSRKTVQFTCVVCHHAQNVEGISYDSVVHYKEAQANSNYARTRASIIHSRLGND